MRYRILLVALATAPIAACGGGPAGVELGDIPARIETVAGDFQRLDPGETAPINLEARVVDAADRPVPGVRVDWTVVGGGTIRPFNRSTDIGGKVVAALTLSRTLGVRDVYASVAADTSIRTAFTIFGGVTSRRPDEPGATVLISLRAFEPNVVAIPAGQSVRWNWSGESPHHIRFADDAIPDVNYRVIGTREIVFSEAGDFAYECTGFRDDGGFVEVNDYPEHGAHFGRVIVH